ncbi:MAG: hypothetical protein DMD41_07975 [Gemmatimonadetes bacterium]|nr:MAG: hypothetical protein DMD41_07975 [Gemmatimonadota bacterium]
MRSALASLAAAALLGGCGGDHAAAAGADPLTLVLADWADYAEARLERRVLALYEQAHPGLRVVQQSAATYQAEYRERILTSMAAGAPPDVFRLDNIDVPGFTDRGAVLDLAPYLPRLGIDLRRYDPTVLSIFSRGAAVYALPDGYTPMVVVYNKDLFDRGGIPYPSDDWTWDDFTRIAKLLTRDTDGDGRIDQWGTAFDRRPFLWIPWIWAGGGDVLCADGRRATGCLDAAATVDAVRWYTDWVTRDSIAPPAPPLPPPSGASALRQSPGDNLRLFATGKVAMLTAGHFWIPNLKPYLEPHRLRMGFVEIPHRAGVPPATVVYASGLAVPALAPHRKRSVELATYLADSLAQTIRAQAGLELPSLASVAESLAARDTLGWERVFLRATQHARMPWGARIGQWREVEAALPDILDRVTIRGDDPAVATLEVARAIDRVLARGGRARR